MKRRIAVQNIENRQLDSYVPIDIPESLMDYACELRVLKSVPFTYLFSNAAEIAEESIRFFVVDTNWTDALLDGAFSIGRVCEDDCSADKNALDAANRGCDYNDIPRMKRMHSNHKNELDCVTEKTTEDYSLVSGFVMRSQLVRRMKGLLLYGYDKEGAPKSNLDDGTPLNILRMDTLADDILICLFHGEVSEIMIAEPKTGLRFGSSSTEQIGNTVSRKIDLRSALDSPDLGTRLENGTYCIDNFIAPNGRVQAKQLAQAVGAQLKSKGKLDINKITPARFAFEMIAVAHRAKFVSKVTKHE